MLQTTDQIHQTTHIFYQILTTEWRNVQADHDENSLWPGKVGEIVHEKAIEF